MTITGFALRGFSLQPMPAEWLNEMATKHHYMHQAIHSRACPFGWALALDAQICRPDGRPAGFIVFASVHFTQLRGEFGYPGLPTKWQVLSLARLWIHPDLQTGGALYSADILPGFINRKGDFESTLATEVIAGALDMVQMRWIEIHPPPFPDEPYHILKVISFANTELFSGEIYRAARFRDTGKTKSQKRHKNSRGAGIGDVWLRRYVYDLDPPGWDYQPLQPRLI
jgi:hypothetical protein